MLILRVAQCARTHRVSHHVMVLPVILQRYDRALDESDFLMMAIIGDVSFNTGLR